ncbi:Uncharacterized protein Rs2_31147 [Raphanus sativus]|nr:Uncharacterized protein Rs2_31147 [Raphanus sativus]
MTSVDDPSHETGRALRSDPQKYPPHTQASLSIETDSRITSYTANLSLSFTFVLQTVERIKSEKVEEALKAQRKAEESFEIEKFEAVEAAGIEAVQRKEEEMKKEIESLKSNHASEASAAQRELERVRQELVAANEAKSKVQSEADDATKMAATVNANQTIQSVQ